MSEPAVKTLLRRGRTLLRSRLARRGFALPALLPFSADPVPAEAAAAFGWATALDRPVPLGPVASPSSSLAAAGSSLGAISTAAALAGFAAVTLLLAPFGDGGVPEKGFSPSAPIETTLRPSSAPGHDAVILIPAARNAPSRLDLLTAFRFTNTPIVDALDAVATAHELNLVVDEHALADAGVFNRRVRGTVSLDLRRATVSEVLDAILKPKGLAYTLRGEDLYITAAGPSLGEPWRGAALRTGGSGG
jgi:hypothetical protein